jgi:hypothetical protein
MRGTALQRYEAMHTLRAQAPAASAAPSPGSAAARAPVGPYALPLPQTSARRAATARLARGWVWSHVGFGLVAAIAGGTLTIAGPGTQLLGAASLSLATIGIAFGALALHTLNSGHTSHAAHWLLAADFVMATVGLLVVGPQLGLAFPLAGAVLVAALLANRWVASVGLGGTFALYALALALTQTGSLQPLAAPSAAALVWLNLIGAGMGTLLLALAGQWLLVQLHAAYASEAALTFRLKAAERRTRAKRVTLDADAMALQTQITQALGNHKPQPVVTGEALAPLAQMINATNVRIPGLLHDRDERLKMERAIRDLIQALEAAWAGFTLDWPMPSHTIVDRLIPLLRPNPTHSTTTLKSMHPNIL